MYDEKGGVLESQVSYINMPQQEKLLCVWLTHSCPQKPKWPDNFSDSYLFGDISLDKSIYSL